MAIFSGLLGLAGITSVSSFFSAPGKMIIKAPKKVKRKASK
jgi:hypothetical protein